MVKASAAVFFVFVVFSEAAVTAISRRLGNGLPSAPGCAGGRRLVGGGETSLPRALGDVPTRRADDHPLSALIGRPGGHVGARSNLGFEGDGVAPFPNRAQWLRVRVALKAPSIWSLSRTRSWRSGESWGRASVGGRGPHPRVAGVDGMAAAGVSHGWTRWRARFAVAPARRRSFFLAASSLSARARRVSASISTPRLEASAARTGS